MYKCQAKFTFYVDSTCFFGEKLSLFNFLLTYLVIRNVYKASNRSVLAQILVELIFVTVETPLFPTTSIHEIWPHIIAV